MSNLPSQSVDTFFQQNPGIDLKTMHLLDEGCIDGFEWKGLTAEKEEIIEELKKYQRLLRVVDDRTTAEKFLKAGIHSAYQIAALSQQLFLQRYRDIFESEEKALHAYRKALHRRSQVELHYINKKERQSPYVKASRFFQS